MPSVFSFVLLKHTCVHLSSVLAMGEIGNTTNILQMITNTLIGLVVRNAVMVAVASTDALAHSKNRRESMPTALRVKGVFASLLGAKILHVEEVHVHSSIVKEPRVTGVGAIMSILKTY